MQPTIARYFEKIKSWNFQKNFDQEETLHGGK